MHCTEHHVSIPRLPSAEMQDGCDEVTALMPSFPFPPSLVLGLPSSSFPIISAHVLAGAPPFLSLAPSQVRPQVLYNHSMHRTQCDVTVELCSPWGRLAPFTLLNTHQILSHCGPAPSKQRSTSWSHTNGYTTTKKYNILYRILNHTRFFAMIRMKSEVAILLEEFKFFNLKSFQSKMRTQ